MINLLFFVAVKQRREVPPGAGYLNTTFSTPPAITTNYFSIANHQNLPLCLMQRSGRQAKERRSTLDKTTSNDQAQRRKQEKK